jgi:hypothetical protein
LSIVNPDFLIVLPGSDSGYDSQPPVRSRPCHLDVPTARRAARRSGQVGWPCAEWRTVEALCWPLKTTQQEEPQVTSGSYGTWRSLVSAPALGAGGRRFKSGRPDHQHQSPAQQGCRRPPHSANRSFRRTLEAENKSPRTVEAYPDAVRFLALYCEAHGKPLIARQLQREHIQDFIADQLGRWKPATAHNRYRSLHAFFKRAVAEGDLQGSPMDGMKPPNLPQQPVGIIRAEQLVRLLKTVRARDLISRRDTAIILLLVDTGMRRAECIGMTVDDIDLDQRMVWVLGKGHRPRTLPLGPQDRSGLGPLSAGTRGASTCLLAEPLDRAQRTHDALGRLPGRARPDPGRGASGYASSPAPACFRHQLAGGGRQ